MFLAMICCCFWENLFLWIRWVSGRLWLSKYYSRQKDMCSLKKSEVQVKFNFFNYEWHKIGTDYDQQQFSGITMIVSWLTKPYCYPGNAVHHLTIFSFLCLKKLTFEKEFSWHSRNFNCLDKSKVWSIMKQSYWFH